MNKLSALAIIVLAGVSFGTAAESTHEGFSVQGSIGHYNQKWSALGESTSESDIGFGIRASYQFSPYVAADVGYFDFGSYSDDYVDGYGDRVTDKVSSEAIKIGVTGFYPVGDSFRLFGRAGLAFWDAKLDVVEHDAPEYSISISDSGNDIYFGVGAEYWVNQRLAVGLEYSYLDIDAAVVGISVSNEVTGIVASIKYAF